VTVYTVQVCYPYEGCSMKGVFSTRALAEAHVEWLATEKKHYRCDLEIDEWDVDELVPVADKETR
jgi:hypothetical protein